MIFHLQIKAKKFLVNIEHRRNGMFPFTYQIECFHVFTSFVVVVVVVVINWTIFKKKRRKISISLFKCKVAKTGSKWELGKNLYASTKSSIGIVKVVWILNDFSFACWSRPKWMRRFFAIKSHNWTEIFYFSQNFSIASQIKAHQTIVVSISSIQGIYATHDMPLTFWHWLLTAILPKTLLLIAFRICFRMFYFYHIIKFTISKCFLK